MTGKPSSETPTPGRRRTIGCVAWVLAVLGAYCVLYPLAMIEYARSAAERLPLLGRVLEFLHLSS
jgi:hypothetical protein